jgi:hypothetical protein
MQLSGMVRLWGRFAALALTCGVADGCARGDNTSDDPGQGGTGSEDATLPLAPSSSTDDASNAGNNVGNSVDMDADASNVQETDEATGPVPEASANDATEEAPPSGGAACPPAYAQSNCLAYVTGIRVSANGDNWLCSNGNCANCNSYSTCAPGETGCPWGIVWTDLGPCPSSNDATEEGPPSGSTACLPAYAQSNCLAYVAGIRVSENGDNWLCSNGNCANCSLYSTCAPGETGCPWGVVWTDLGPCP